MTKLEKTSTIVAIIVGLLGIISSATGFFSHNIEDDIKNSVWKVCFHCSDTADYNYFVLGENRDLIGFDMNQATFDIDSIESVRSTAKGDKRGIYLKAGNNNFFFKTSGNWLVKDDELIIRIFEADKNIASISAYIDDEDIKRIVGEGSMPTGNEKFPVEMNRVF